MIFIKNLEKTYSSQNLSLCHLAPHPELSQWFASLPDNPAISPVIIDASKAKAKYHYKNSHQGWL